MQKGFSLIIPIIIILGLLAVMFVPIPYYQKDTVCIFVYPTKCYGGWQLGQPLWKRIFQANTQQPVSYSQPTSSPRLSDEKCVVGGCSGQLCLQVTERQEDQIVSTCEWREEYGCYRTAKCEKQSDGKCGWTKTEELNKCLQGAETSQYDGLVSKVKSKGVLSIIVSFDIPANDEKSIAEEQEKLLNALSSYNVSSVNKFKYTPAMSFEVDEEALNFLISLPGIKNIQENRLSAPSN